MTPVDVLSLYHTPNALAGHYSHFRVAERLLLTGHSHQAWPDCALEGQRQAWLDAAEHVDDKWEHAFAQADAVRRGFARLLDDDPARIALGASTHELLVRFLSALPLSQRARIVTTDAEFHTARRQLARLAEEGVEIRRVAHAPAATVADRLAEAVTPRTAAVVVSAVFFHNAHIAPGLSGLMERCRTTGTELLVDAYHALNAIPFSLKDERLVDAFVIGGGYKYCQLGEGNCFLRVPPDCAMRPVITGWFSEFGALSESGAVGRVEYPPGPGRFAGATYDPTSNYRAARVFTYFDRQGLTPAVLRQVSRHQVERLAAGFDSLDADPAIIRRDPAVPLAAIGGFLALQASQAAELVQRLRRRGVRVDARGDLLRLGPAPYLADAQLDAAIGAVGEAAGELAR